MRTTFTYEDINKLDLKRINTVTSDKSADDNYKTKQSLSSKHNDYETVYPNTRVFLNDEHLIYKEYMLLDVIGYHHPKTKITDRSSIASAIKFISQRNYKSEVFFEESALADAIIGMVWQQKMSVKYFMQSRPEVLDWKPLVLDEDHILSMM